MSFKKLFIKSEEDTPVIKKEANFTPGQGMTSEQHSRRVSEQNPYPAFGGMSFGGQAPASLNTSELTEGISSDVILTIEDIYTAEGIENLDNSIYKVLEFADSLPKELSTVAKKQSVLGILKTVKLDVNNLIEDGKHRTIRLTETSDLLLTKANDTVKSNIEEIEELEAKIEALKNENTVLTKTSEDQTALIKGEISLINNIIEFIKPIEEAK
jgi:multidrug efflux pump subunit AcrA (membrane-fusion protein)